MVLLDGRIVLLDPRVSRSRSETSSFSVGAQIKVAVENHNASLNDEEEKFALTMPTTTMRYSNLVYATVSRKLSDSQLFAPHVGKRSYRDIKKQTEGSVFERAMEHVVKAVNSEHKLLSFAEGSWATVSSIIRKLRNSVAHANSVKTQKNRNLDSNRRGISGQGKISKKKHRNVDSRKNRRGDDCDGSLGSSFHLSQNGNKPLQNKIGRRVFISDSDDDDDYAASKCMVLGCNLKTAASHKCQNCRGAMHNICGQKALADAHIDGEFYCSMRCMSLAFKRMKEN